MAHLLQVGAGSGGMSVLDILARDQHLTQVTLIEPDIYQSHNVVRHLFSTAGIGVSKAALAKQWLGERRPDLDVRILSVDVTDPAKQDAIHEAAAAADIGVCAADNENAKYHWDALMRRHRLPWTLGEVLSGGIGGFVHWFVPDGPCYACVASYLQRSVKIEEEKAPDYSQPGGPMAEATVPANKAAIQAIAALHASVTLELLEEGTAYQPGFTSLLWTLRRVPGVFEEAFRPYRFRVPRGGNCLVCRTGLAATPSGSAEELDAALDKALTRLGNA